MSVSGWLRAHRYTLLRVAGLVASGGCFAVAGSLSAFTEYALAFKDSFNLTQEQVEVTESMWSLANDLGYPAGLMGEKLGSRVTLGLALTTVFTVYMLLWATKYSVSFYVAHQWLLYIYYMLIGFGTCCGFVTVLPVMLKNFKSEQHGAVTGLMFSFFAVGPAVYSAVYGGCFVDGYVFDAAKQNLSGFYLFNAITCLVLYLLGIIFIREIPKGEEDRNEMSIQEELAEKSFREDLSTTPTPGEDTHLIDAKDQGKVKTKDPEKVNDSFEENSITTATANLPPPPQLTGCALFRKLEFQLLLWPFVLSSSTQLTFWNNISAILKSFNNASYITLAAVLAPMVIVVSTLVLGIVSDCTAKKVPRVAYLIVANTLQFLFFTLANFYAGNTTLFIMTVIANSVSAGVTMTMTPTILAEISGTQYLGRNLGGMIIGQGAGVFILQTLVGVIYDANKGDENDRNCYGESCFRVTFIILSVLAFLTVAWQICQLCVVLRRRKNSSEG